MDYPELRILMFLCWIKLDRFPLLFLGESQAPSTFGFYLVVSVQTFNCMILFSHSAENVELMSWAERTEKKSVFLFDAINFMVRVNITAETQGLPEATKRRH